MTKTLKPEKQDTRIEPVITKATGQGGGFAIIGSWQEGDGDGFIVAMRKGSQSQRGG